MVLNMASWPIRIVRNSSHVSLVLAKSRDQLKADSRATHSAPLRIEHRGQKIGASSS